MNETLGLDELDRDLTRVSSRLKVAGFDPERARRRLFWEHYGPIAMIVALGVFLLAAAGVGKWWVVVVVALVHIPNRIERWRKRREERAAIADSDDFLEREREYLEKRIEDERFQGVFYLGLAALLAFLAWRGWGRVEALWILAGLVAAGALLRILLTGPALVRELRDLGGDAGGWFMPVVLALLVVATPFLVVFGMLRRGVRRLLGRPAEDDE